MSKRTEKEDPIYQCKLEINKIKTALELTDIQRRILKERYEKSGDKTRLEFLLDLDQRPEFYEENLEQCKRNLKKLQALKEEEAQKDEKLSRRAKRVTKEQQKYVDRISEATGVDFHEMASKNLSDVELQ